MDALIYISVFLERHHRPRNRSRLALFMEIKTIHHERDHYFTGSQLAGSLVLSRSLHMVGKERAV